LGGCVPELAAAATADKTTHAGNLWFTSHEEGSNTITVNEPGGVIALTSDTADDDLVCLFAGKFQPADGGCVMEVRFKVDDVLDCAMFAGFSETLHLTGDVVMPATFSGTTLTIAGSGGVAGMLHDMNATTDAWRAVAGDGGAAASDLATASGTVSGEGVAVNDEWDIVRVEMDVNGDAKIYHDGVLIDDVKACVTAGDQFYAMVILSNRDSGGAQKLEVDYFFAEGGRDWTV